MKAIGWMAGVALWAACSSPDANTLLIVGATPAPGGDGDALPATDSDASSTTPTPPVGSAERDAAAARDASSRPTTDASISPTGTSPGVPCDVAMMLAQLCTGCHSDPPIPGALAGLVTLADLQATSKEDPTKNEAELSVARMTNAAAPMPPGALPAAASVAILQNWISAGYPSGSCGGSADGGDAGGIVVTPPPSIVFQGAPAFVARNGPNAHNAGRDCMSCHRNAGGDAPQFSFGGTLYDANGSALGGAEVRIVDTNGKASSVYTATNGTFYQNGSGFAAPAHIGVRNATASAEMFTPLQAANGGACSSCHCTGASCAIGLIHLP